MSGFIKLHRSMLEWEWFQDTNTFKLFTTMLFMANWKQKKWKEIVIERGQFISSIQCLSDTSGLSVQNVRTSLRKLRNSKNLTSKPTNRYTLYTIVNYGKFQDLDYELTSQLTNNQQTTNKQLTTTKERKERKEDSKGTRISSNWVLNDKNRKYASSKGLTNIDSIGEHFKNHHLSKGSVMKNWDAAWATWVLNQIKFNPESVTKIKSNVTVLTRDGGTA